MLRTAGLVPDAQVFVLVSPFSYGRVFSPVACEWPTTASESGYPGEPTTVESPAACPVGPPAADAHPGNTRTAAATPNPCKDRALQLRLSTRAPKGRSTTAMAASVRSMDDHDARQPEAAGQPCCLVPHVREPTWSGTQSEP